MKFKASQSVVSHIRSSVGKQVVITIDFGYMQ